MRRVSIFCLLICFGIPAFSSEKNSPVVFPCLIPPDPLHKQYYLHYEAFDRGENNGYILSAGYTADCHGAHVCSVGYLLAENRGKPEIMQDRNGKVITMLVTLAGNTRAYYTPGHAMGSYFPPRLQWYKAGILYTLSWDDRLVDRTLLVKMASTCKIK